MRAKKASAERRIRHKLTQPLHPSNPTQSTLNRKKTHWVAWRKTQGGFIKINFDGSKISQRAVGGFILRNWEGRFVQA